MHVQALVYMLHLLYNWYVKSFFIYDQSIL
jgi:hypothetical protein